eukprot:1367475-Amorphochlora_amoeboformis.AAC.1
MKSCDTCISASHLRKRACRLLVYASQPPNTARTRGAQSSLAMLKTFVQGLAGSIRNVQGTFIITTIMILTTI